MSHDPPQKIIDDLAEGLQRSVVIDDPGVRLLYASQHYGDEDEVRTHAMLQRRASSAAIGHVLAQGVSGWTTPGVIPPNAEIDMHARVCYPIRWRGELIALLLVVDAEGSITTTELSSISAAGDQLAPMLAAERQSDDDTKSEAEQVAVGDLCPTAPWYVWPRCGRSTGRRDLHDVRAGASGAAARRDEVKAPRIRTSPRHSGSGYRHPDVPGSYGSRA